MEITIYVLCSLTCILCAFLLFRGYFSQRYRLLFWSGLCFSALSVNNILLVLDKTIFLDADLLTWRLAAGLVALLLLLYGLILEKS